jgi:hypothetical protein
LTLAGSVEGISEEMGLHNGVSSGEGGLWVSDVVISLRRMKGESGCNLENGESSSLLTSTRALCEGLGSL